MTRGCISCGHQKTAEAGIWALNRGGNAFDAAVAAFWAACICEPALASAGGGGFLLGSSENQDPFLLDFFVQTPQQKRPQNSRSFFPITGDFGGVTQVFHVGSGSVATPGAVKGMFDIQQQRARLPMAELIKPAVELARDGCEMNQDQAYVLDIIQPIFLASDPVRAIFESTSTPGKTLRPGEKIYLKAFADWLEILAKEGPGFFYENGADNLIDDNPGGHLSVDDLRQYSCVHRQPLLLELGGTKLWTNPLPSAGGSLIQMALKSVTNPGCTEQRLKALLAADDIKPLFAKAPQSDELALQYHQSLRAYRGTTHMSIADEFGNLASMTVTNGEGCARLVRQGFMLNNMLGEEDLNPNGWHQWPPNQRMISMMAPTILRLDNQNVVLGSGGSNRIRSAIFQVCLNLIQGMGLKEAVLAPRMHVENQKLDYEPNLNGADLSFCHKYGLKIHSWQDKNLFFGGVHAVAINKEGFSGFGDPRRSGVYLSNNS